MYAVQEVSFIDRKSSLAENLGVNYESFVLRGMFAQKEFIYTLTDPCDGIIYCIVCFGMFMLIQKAVVCVVGHAIVFFVLNTCQ